MSVERFDNTGILDYYYFANASFVTGGAWVMSGKSVYFVAML